MQERSFVRYQISLYLANKEDTTSTSKLDLLTPSSCFETVDQPFWEQLQQLKVCQIDVRKKDERKAISEYLHDEGYPFSLAGDRQHLLNTLCGSDPLYLSEQVPTGSTLHQLLPTEQEIAFASLMFGRQLLLDEVLQAGADQLHTTNPLKTLQTFYLQGFFDWSSPVGLHRDQRNSSDSLFCRRCGYGQEQESPSFWEWCTSLFREEQRIIRVSCASCGRDHCGYCPRCLHLGRAKACQPYLEWKVKGHVGQKSEIRSQWEGELSPVQRAAADQLYHYVHLEQEPQQGIKEFLIWAVCGSGKTEMLFQTIARSLSKGQKILLTSPRRDVIVELAPRMKQAFPESQIRVLHAESTEKYEAGDLYLATSHQTLRFKDYFDLLIIDEEDAFPYHDDKMLPYVVHRARKKEGVLVYLTATPRAKMVERVHRKTIHHVLISKRFHGHPLAVPRICPLGKWRNAIEKGEIITEVVHFLTHLISQQRYGYLFVPHVQDLAIVETYIVTRLLPYVQSKLAKQENVWPSSFKVQTVHAQDPDRADKVDQFRKQKIHLLITTTILERGVTIPYSDAAVLGSDDPIFDTAALIQISGRVGRKVEDPVGQVWFFPDMRSEAQTKCVRSIAKWNQMAIEKEDRL